MSTPSYESSIKPVAPPQPVGFQQRCRRLLLTLSNVADGVSATALFILMALSFVDVIGREVFNHPLPGAMELTELLMATIIFAVLPSISYRGEQIAVDLLDPFLPRKIKILQLIVANLLGTATFSVIGWQLWVDAQKLALYGGTTPYLEFPLSPFVQAISILSFATALGFFLAIFRRNKELS